MESHMGGFVKKTQVMASALQQQGRTSAAVARLGSSISLLASLGIAAQGVRALVQSLVVTRASLQNVTDDATADAQRKPVGKAGSRC